MLGDPSIFIILSSPRFVRTQVSLLIIVHHLPGESLHVFINQIFQRGSPGKSAHKVPESLLPKQLVQFSICHFIQLLLGIAPCAAAARVGRSRARTARVGRSLARTARVGRSPARTARVVRSPARVGQTLSLILSVHTFVFLYFASGPGVLQLVFQPSGAVVFLRSARRRSP